MNVMFRSCPCVFLVIGCFSVAQAEEKPGPQRGECGAAQPEEKPGPSRAEYDKFLQTYTAKPQSWHFRGQKPLKLIVTAIMHDEPKANGELDFDRLVRAGIDVSNDWQVYWFDIGPFAAKSGTSSSSKINDVDQKRLDTLLSNLPDDGRRLPPFYRRLVLQIPEGDHCRAKVYDRGNAPDEVCEILRLSQSRIRSWVLEFKSEHDVNAGDDGKGDIPALASKGQLVTAVANGLPE